MPAERYEILNAQVFTAADTPLDTAVQLIWSQYDARDRRILRQTGTTRARIKRLLQQMRAFDEEFGYQTAAAVAGQDAHRTATDGVYRAFGLTDAGTPLVAGT